MTRRSAQERAAAASDPAEAASVQKPAKAPGPDQPAHLRTTFAERAAGTRLHLRGRLIEASNATFLGELLPAGVEPAEEVAGELCVYKPVRGEQPLWDFPDGTLAQREVAAYLVSSAGGFDLVPETLLVEGPLGPGSLQRWIETGESETELVSLVPAGEAPDDWFTVLQGVDQLDRPVQVVHADVPELRRMALFDAVVNNSDRKGAHILYAPELPPPGARGAAADDHPSGPVKVWGVDHGVCLHAEDKLRTVLWGWADEQLSTTERELVAASAAAAEELEGLITAEEIAALEQRCADLLDTGRFPMPSTGWPSIPWPPI